MTALSARLAQGGPDAGINSVARWLLVGLRLTIGWHFLVEGLDKIHTPGWSSEAYLREATGPLAPYFRKLAGDRLLDKLTVGPDNTFPAELEIEWRAYFDEFVRFYELTGETLALAQAKYDQEKAKTLTWLTAERQPVQVTGAVPPAYLDELTMAQRLERHALLEARVREIETDIPKLGKELFKQYKEAKKELADWRADLKKDLDQRFAHLKKVLRDDVLLPLLPQMVPAQYRVAVTRPEPDPKKKEEFETKLKDWYANLPMTYARIKANQRTSAVDGNAAGEKLGLSSQAERIFLHAVIRSPHATVDELLPHVPARPISSWRLLDWSDAIVKYGLVITGGCLLVGLLTRSACLAGAVLLLSFYLAMPPLPGWPENPRAEGHYLYINKNVIEMFALLALAAMPTGRWAGVDGFLALLRPARWRKRPASDSVN
ncbi:MAG: hypothetical protein NZO58_03320 [Gemmataceae bacterium]|nr:hypothetical protein [Gemmataceae bacterium]